MVRTDPSPPGALAVLRSHTGGGWRVVCCSPLRDARAGVRHKEAVQVWMKENREGRKEEAKEKNELDKGAGPSRRAQNAGIRLPAVFKAIRRPRVSSRPS